MICVMCLYENLNDTQVYTNRVHLLSLLINSYDYIIFFVFQSLYMINDHLLSNVVKIILTFYDYKFITKCITLRLDFK